MCSVDDWLHLDWGAEYEYIQFNAIVFENPLEGFHMNLEEALFGMPSTDLFGSLKMGIGNYCNLEKINICLFWNDEELLDEDTPSLLGMEVVANKSEDLRIYTISYKFES